MSGNHGTPPSAAVVTIDRSFRVRGWPEHATALFGWSPAQAAGQEVSTLLGAAILAEAVRSWCACRHRCEPRRADGATLVVHVLFEPLPPPDDTVAVLRFEPESVQAAAQREAEARYESVVTAMQEGVVVFAPDGRVTSCNPAATRILGLPAVELVGRSLRDPRWRLVRENGLPLAADDSPAAITMRTGISQRGVVVGVDRGGGSRAWLSVSSAPVPLQPDAPQQAVVATFVDVTEARLAAERAKRLASLLPVCAWCKSVRNDRGYWQQIEHYLTEHTDTRFTHGLCPACSAKLAGSDPPVG